MISRDRLDSLRALVGDELRRVLFGEMPKFCMWANLPAERLVEIARSRGLQEEEVQALAWTMIDDFAAAGAWPT